MIEDWGDLEGLGGVWADQGIVEDWGGSGKIARGL